MPELPEVEIHARNLRQWLVGRTILEFQALDPLLPGEGTLPLENARIAGAQVERVERDAKYLFIQLDNGHTLVAHLRMTGRFIRQTYDSGTRERAPRAVLLLDSGERVVFEDRRRFGRIWLAKTQEVRRIPELRQLGPDALLHPTSAERLAEIARKSRRPIKVLLMDQRLIGGLGNICAIEILFQAGIAPQTPAIRLTPEQVADLARITPEYLEWAIRAQSRRELIYIGEKGAENVFPIYRRDGTPCPRCGTPILRTVLGGRGTYSCPACQR